MNRLMIIDGQSILEQAYYGLPEYKNTKGNEINAVIGFLSILTKVTQETEMEQIVVVFDDLSNSLRRTECENYKRSYVDMPIALVDQVDIAKVLCKKMGVILMDNEGFEQLDLICSLTKMARNQEFEVSILTSNELYFQLLDEHVFVNRMEIKEGVLSIATYSKDSLMEMYGFTPKEYFEFLCLCGCSQYNVSGISGIGVKMAINLISRFHTISDLYCNLEAVSSRYMRKCLIEQQETVERNHNILSMKDDSILSFDFSLKKTDSIFNENVMEYLATIGYNSFSDSTDSYVMTPMKIEIQTNIITDLIEMEQFFSDLSKQKCIGLFPLFQQKDFIGLGVAVEDGIVDFIACSMFITQDLIAKRIESLLIENPSLTVITKDLKVLLKLITIKRSNQIKDVSLGAYLLDPNQENYEYDILAETFLNTKVIGRKVLLDKMILTPFLLQEDSVKKYIGYETYIPFAVWNNIYAKLSALNMQVLYDDIELPTVYVLDHMEKEGIRVKKEELGQYSDMLSKRISELEQLIYQEAQETFNINSPKQLGEILFEKMMLPGGKKTKTGYSTNVDVLTRLKNDYPIVANVLEYRQVAKLKSTYADGLVAFISSDERIHGTFNQTITATGRISSTEPNLQNIPMRTELGRGIRKVFIPKEDYVFVDADYSQIELRVLAHFSGDKKLIDAYRKEEDIHAITASQVFGVPLDKVDSLMRRNAKAVNFGIVYGISAFGLAEDLNISIKEASAYIDSYFVTYPGVKEYLDQTITDAKATGMSRTLFGRIRQIPELTSSNFMQRNFGERVAMNAPIQGTAADIIKIAMIRVYDRLQKEKCKSSLILQIHDELLIETHRDEVELVKTILQEEMVHAVTLEVPLCIDVSVGNNWYEAK